MLDSLISAGANIIGGLFGMNSQEDANEAMKNNVSAQMQMQEQFAKNGIKWKVQDAKNAGIHPLYALGASTPTYTPVSLTQDASNPMGNAIAAAGQDLSRAIHSTRSQSERTEAVASTQAALQLKNMDLQNELLSAQIAKLRTTTQSPAMPIGQRYAIPGQGQTATGPLVTDQPLKRTIWDPSNPSIEPGSTTDIGYLNTPGGGYFPVPSTDAKEKIEDNWWQESAHFLRNNIFPAISPYFNNPPYPAPKNSAWVFNPIYGYKLVPDKWHRKFFRY